MLTSTRSLVAVGSCLALAGIASAFALQFAAQGDYEAIPPNASEVQAKLAAIDGSLAEAVRKAEEEFGGKAMSAILDLDETPPTVLIVLYADDAEHHITINAEDMSIASRETKPPFEFPGWEPEGEWVETSSGLKYMDIVEGDGRQADPSKTVTVHYTGWLVDGTKFDSSVDRGQPATFPLRGVIRGWTEGVGTMREGGKRKLKIPYNMAYGPSGRPPTIPPRAMLLFDVELINVRD